MNWLLECAGYRSGAPKNTQTCVWSKNNYRKNQIDLTPIVNLQQILVAKAKHELDWNKNKINLNSLEGMNEQMLFFLTSNFQINGFDRDIVIEFSSRIIS